MRLEVFACLLFFSATGNALTLYKPQNRVPAMAPLGSAAQIIKTTPRGSGLPISPVRVPQPQPPSRPAPRPAPSDTMTPTPPLTGGVLDLPGRVTPTPTPTPTPTEETGSFIGYMSRGTGHWVKVLKTSVAFIVEETKTTGDEKKASRTVVPIDSPPLNQSWSNKNGNVKMTVFNFQTETTFPLHKATYNYVVHRVAKDATGKKISDFWGISQKGGFQGDIELKPTPEH